MPIIHEAVSSQSSIIIISHIIVACSHTSLLSCQNVWSFLPIDCSGIVYTFVGFLAYFPNTLGLFKVLRKVGKLKSAKVVKKYTEASANISLETIALVSLFVYFFVSKPSFLQHSWFCDMAAILHGGQWQKNILSFQLWLQLAWVAGVVRLSARDWLQTNNNVRALHLCGFTQFSLKHLKILACHTLLASSIITKYLGMQKINLFWKWVQQSSYRRL